MPNPKRRHSKTRTAKRRTHDALERFYGPLIWLCESFIKIVSDA